jgi:hypothetical protein
VAVSWFQINLRSQIVSIFAVPILLFFAAFSLGWIVPLVVGVRRSKAQQGGVGCIVLGGVWGFFAVSGIALASVFFLTYRSMERKSEYAAFDPASFEGATGSIDVPGEGDVSLRLRCSDSGEQYQLGGQDGVLTAPVGSYSVTMYQRRITGSDGVTWRASASTLKGDSAGITVPEGGRVELRLGAPFSTKVQRRSLSDGRQSFNLGITGRCGNRFSIRAWGKTGVAPGFEAVSGSGEVVWSGKFAYG